MSLPILREKDAFIIQVSFKTIIENRENSILIKLCVRCLEKCLTVLNVSSWGNEFDHTITEYLLPYSSSISLLRSTCLIELPKCKVYENNPSLTIDHFCESLKALFISWFNTIENGRVKLNECLHFLENQESIKEFLNEELYIKIKEKNILAFEAFKQKLQDLREEILPVVNHEDICKRLVI